MPQPVLANADFPQGLGLQPNFVFDAPHRASTIGSATPNEGFHRAERSKHPCNKAFDKSGVHSTSPQVTDVAIEVPHRIVRSEAHSTAQSRRVRQ